MNNRWNLLPVVFIVVAVLAVGCRSTTGQSLGQNIDDKTITATVKAKLVADRAKNLTAVDVDTNAGVVYLTGFVDTAQQKAEAEQLARSTDGVKRVVNNLMIDSARAASAQTPTSGTGAAQAQSAASASPATGAFVGRHTMTGEVTMIDRERGHMRSARSCRQGNRASSVTPAWRSHPV